MDRLAEKSTLPDLSHAELTLLLDLGERLTSELDLDNVLALVATTACQVVQAETLAVPMIDPDGQMFTYRAASGEYAAMILGQTFPIHEGACGWVIGHQRPLLFGEEGSFDLDTSAKWQKGMASSLLVPLICRGTIIGGLSAMGKQGGGAFNLRDLTVLTLFANQASVAIDNARLFQKLNLEESRMRLVLDSASEGIFGVDTQGICTFVNQSCLRMLGYERPDDMIGKNTHMLIHHTYPDGRPYPIQECSVRVSVLDGKTSHADDEVHWRADGSSFPVEFWSHPIYRNDQIEGAVVTFIDITERKQAEEAVRTNEARFRHMLETSPIAVRIAASLGHKTLFANQRYAELINFSRDNVIGTDPKLFYANPQDYEDILRQLDQGVSITNKLVELKIPGARTTWALASYYRMEYQNEQAVLAWLYDVTDLKNAEDKIHKMAFYDDLTQLPNRRLLMDRLGQALITSNRTKEFGALMIMDLDNFKILNDTLGHDAGDLLLIEVAQRLLGNVRQEDTVSRLGGDEYVVMAENLGTDQISAAKQAEMIAEKIRSTLSQPYAISRYGQAHHSTSSIGVALFCGQALSIDVLLKQADVALYQAKGAGRNTIRFFNPEMQAAIDSRSAMEAAMRNGLLLEEFQLFYQPQINQDGQLTGAEGLLRWFPPNQAPISPAQFITHCRGHQPHHPDRAMGDADGLCATQGLG